jgi:broad specificity phosphatase PhoE
MGLSKNARIIFERHGLTPVNVLKKRKFFTDEAEREALRLQLGGTFDQTLVPLAPEGVEQAKNAGREFAARFGTPDLVVSSNAVRAIVTAAKQIEVFGGAVPLCIDARLMERDFGEVEDMTAAEMAVRYPHFQEERDQIGGFFHAPPGGESLSELATGRVLAAVTDLKKLAKPGTTILVSTHLNVLRVIRYLMENLDPEQLRRDWEMKIGNCELIAYELHESRWILLPE